MPLPNIWEKYLNPLKKPFILVAITGGVGGDLHKKEKGECMISKER